MQPGSYLIPVTGGGATRQVVMQPQAAPPQPLTLQRALTHPAPPPEQPSTQQPFVQGKRAPAQPVLKINSTNGGKFASKMQRRLIPLLRKSVPSCTIIVYNHVQQFVSLTKKNPPIKWYCLIIVPTFVNVVCQKSKKILSSVE